MKNQKRTTIYDIARKLNLNASSVSRALSNTSKVSEATKKLILDTAKEMNYQPNSLASNLRRGSNRTIGVVVPRINQNFFANVIAGLEEITYENGYNLVICQSNESYEREVECVNTLINQQVNCIVISVTADFKEDAHIRNIQKHGIQLIQFDRVADEVDTLKVVNDNKQSSIEAISHLISQGYKRIALLEGPQNLNIFRQRKEGYLEALAIHGIETDPLLMKKNAWTKELSVEATRELLSLSNPPDAIFASTSDFSALGVLEVATKMGFSVPKQLGICGYSNEAFTEITSPSITTIDQHSIKMGNAIARLYFKEAKSEAEFSVPKIINIKPELIIRASSLKDKS
ncbi:MAG: LacI family DNA-binding transcriptional regulator [Bacteroidota bacterium]